MGKLVKIFLLISSTLLILSCEQTVYTGPPDEPAPQNRRVFVQSKPAGATIYLNGKNLGIQTPDTIKWLPSEKSAFTLKLPLYTDTTFNVDVVEGETRNIFVDFTVNSKNVGKIFCDSDPSGADIWLNDSLTNKRTPITLSRLLPGDYKIKLTSSLHRPDSTHTNVSAGTVSFIYMTLEDTSKWVSYNIKNSHTISNYISSLACDKSNRIWIGTEVGIMVFNGEKFAIYTTYNSPLPTDVITCIAVDDQNRKWIGTAMGVMVFENGIWTDYSANLPNLNVTAITFDHSGNAWIGTYNGLVKYSNGTWQTFVTNNSGLKENFVTCLAVDSRDRIWIGYKSHGVSVYDGKSWANYNTSDLHSKYLTLEFAQAIACDNKDKVWVSAMNPTADYSSTLIFDGTSWSQYLGSSNTTYSIYVTGAYILFGCKLELGILNNDTGKYTSYYHNANTALPLFKLQAVTMDNTNNIWIGTFMHGFGKLKAGNY